MIILLDYHNYLSVSVSVHKVDNLSGGLGPNDACLWQEYSGWHLEKCATSHSVAGTTNGASEVKVSNIF